MLSSRMPSARRTTAPSVKLQPPSARVEAGERRFGRLIGSSLDGAGEGVASGGGAAASGGASSSGKSKDSPEGMISSGLRSISARASAAGYSKRRRFLPKTK